MALAAGLLVAFCALMAGEGVYYRLQAERFDAASIAEFRAAVPDVTRRVIPAEAERLLAARLSGLGGGEASSYLQLMAALGELTSGNERVRICLSRRSIAILPISTHSTPAPARWVLRLRMVVRARGGRPSRASLR